jgi:hypothetical protein
VDTLADLRVFVGISKTAKSTTGNTV